MRVLEAGGGSCVSPWHTGGSGRVLGGLLREVGLWEGTGGTRRVLGVRVGTGGVCVGPS